MEWYWLRYDAIIQTYLFGMAYESKLIYLAVSLYVDFTNTV